MRIWDVEPRQLCRSHLLGLHREIHAIYSVIYNNKKGYSRHPETLRWIGKLPALWERHQDVVDEMILRGYKHLTPLPYVTGKITQDLFLTPIKEQEEILGQRNCPCLLKEEG